MRKTTNQEKPVRGKPSKADTVARMKEHLTMIKERMNDHKDSPQYKNWKRRLARINQRIKDYEGSVR